MNTKYMMSDLFIKTCEHIRDTRSSARIFNTSKDGQMGYSVGGHPTLYNVLDGVVDLDCSFLRGDNLVSGDLFRIYMANLIAQAELANDAIDRAVKDEDEDTKGLICDTCYNFVGLCKCYNGDHGDGWLAGDETNGCVEVLK